MKYGRTISIYLDDGTPDGIVMATLSNWSGVGLKVPRSEILRKDYAELDQPGVYFLICTDTEDEKDAVYIGEAENLRKRLLQHIAEFKSGKEDFYWQCAVVFTGSELNKALIRYLEHNLTVRARAAGRYTVLTKNTYSDTVLKKQEKSAMTEFMDNIKILMSALNFRILDPKPSHTTDAERPESETQEKQEEDYGLLHMDVRGCHGKGYLTADGGFVLKAGSTISSVEYASCGDGNSRMRKSAIETGKVIDWVTVEDIEFKSTSAAAAFVAGTQKSGPLYWKNSEGVSLLDLRKKL
ncbi:MAG: GIY-YIG nuclease family protein [Bullifex sp.]